LANFERGWLALREAGWIRERLADFERGWLDLREAGWL
jgi:hypothetical protein